METTPLKLTMTCAPYDRAQALIDGSVKPQGIDLTVTAEGNHLGRQQKIRDGGYDVCEFFTGTYIADLPFRALGFTAIPVFPHRMFRHSNIHISRKSGIREPSDLNGKRVGVRFWNITAGVWVKGILEEEHGVDLSSITWVACLPVAIPGWSPPPWLKLEMAPKGSTEYDLLASGATAAAITADGWPTGRHPDIERLFPDYEQREREFFDRTQCVPIMHTLLVRTGILEEYPWVARSLFDAWEESRRLCYEHREPSGRLHAPPPAVPGTPWNCEYGFSKSRQVLDRLLTYAHRQGVTPRKFQPEDMFWPSMLET